MTIMPIARRAKPDEAISISPSSSSTAKISFGSCREVPFRLGARMGFTISWLIRRVSVLPHPILRAVVLKGIHRVTHTIFSLILSSSPSVTTRPLRHCEGEARRSNLRLTVPLNLTLRHCEPHSSSLRSPLSVIASEAKQSSSHRHPVPCPLHPVP